MAALQLLSHLEGDALNVALLVPMSRRTSITGMVDAMSAHYGSPGRLADYRRQFDKTTRTAGEVPSIFTIALETLAVKAFGDMGQTARLRLIRDRFIAGHSNCELRRYLDSVPPETPIPDVVDRCRVWESHANPEVRRISKPSPDPIYPAYVVGDSDNIGETRRVAADTRPKPGPDQLEDILKRLLAGMGAPVSVPAPVPEMPAVETLLQRLVAETQSRPPPVESPPEPVGLEKLFTSYLSGQQAPTLAAPRRMMDIEFTDAPELSGGGPQSVPSRISVVLAEEAIPGGTPRLGCPRDDQNGRLLAGVAQPARVTVSENSLGLPCVRGMLSSFNITDIEVTNAPELSGGGPPSVPSRISVVLVDEAKAGGTPRLGCPRDHQDIRLLAGVAKPASVTFYDDSLGSPCIGGMLSSSDIAGRLPSVVPAGISFTVGPTDPANPNNPLITNNPIGPSDSDPAGPYVAGGLLVVPVYL